MAGEDLKNRIDWLDEERRKDKASLSKMEERLKAQTAASESQAKQLQELSSQLASWGAKVQPKKLDELLARHRDQTSREIESMEKRRLDLEEKSQRSRSIEKERLETGLGDLQKQVSILKGMSDTVDTVRAEQVRHSSSFQDMHKTLDAIQRRDEDRTRILAAAEEGRRQDMRRMSDIQGEQQAMRNKNAENDSRLEALDAANQRLESRLAELLSLELERRNAMALWQEQQTAAAGEVERKQKEWEQQIAEPASRIQEFLSRLEAYNETYRSMRKAIDDFREMAERQDQRLREMAEIQRLQEDRLRQDWNTFLADDQKRWTAQNLAREEEWREMSRQLGKAVDRLSKLEEQMENVSDSLRAVLEGDQARLETLANTIREWLARIPQR